MPANFTLNPWFFAVRKGTGRPVFLGVIQEHSQFDPLTTQFAPGHRVFTGDLVECVVENQQYTTYNGETVYLAGEQGTDQDWEEHSVLKLYGDRVESKIFHELVVLNAAKCAEEAHAQNSGAVE